MVKFKQNNIDDFFRDAFQNHQPDDQQSSWFDIDARVSKNNFMKFSSYSFNIYYLVLIACTLLFTVYLGIDKFIIAKNNSMLKAPVQKTNIVADTVYQVKTEYKIIEKKIIVEKDQKNDETLTNNELSATSGGQDNTSGNDSTFFNQKNTVYDTSRNVIVIKPQPIIVRDTIKLPGRSPY